ncbi:unnamed protein product [Vitrella brassicaformis CCMP3155]|uniref:AP2/ERF domain-containing protein n=1 Tax=Vitrella brassicaformis (strain CCMP3155) TaxID=1169540 RepID=A0A0G4G3N7_VITBC|nr:unnamed protein product [Vitrella brassicaformis CCMP3155]|eukprot:CEM22562.1 unnamed protein product [Vitrella brassicaformis CCMP3155]
MQQPTVEQPSAADGGQAAVGRDTSAEVACLDAGQLTVHNEAITGGQTPHASEAATSDAGKGKARHRHEHQSSVAAVDSLSSSPHSRRRRKAANRDGASVSAGDVWSSICVSDPQWAADRDKKTSTKGKTVITKSVHQSDVAGVAWHNAGQAWHSGWYEKGDPNKKSKYFYVKDHGFDRAKTLAEQHRCELERTGRAAVKKRAEHQSGVRGVHYHKGSNAWVASWQEGGRQRKEKKFSVRQLGYEGAKRAAISHRRKMEKRHHEYRVAASPPPPSFELDDDSRPPIRPTKRRRKDTMDHSSTADDTQPTDSNGRPADESASDIARLDTTSDTASLAILLEGVRASDPESGGRYEIVTVTVAGQQTGAIRWMPTGVDVPSDGRVTAQAMRVARPSTQERSEPLPLPHAEASTAAHRNNGCADPEERHAPSSSVDGHGGHNGRVASADRSPPPKLCGPAGRHVAGGLTGDALARALVRWMRYQQPGEFHAPDRGGIGISWRTNHSYEAYFWDSDASKAVDLRQFPVGYGASGAAIFTAFREAVEYRNALHRSRVGDQAMLIDLSWLQRTQQGQGQDGVPGVPPSRSTHLNGGNNRSKRPRLEGPPLDSPLCPHPAPPAAPHLPARPRTRREGDATLDRRARQRSSVARAARQSDEGSRSPSPQPRRRPKAAKRDGASVSAGDVWSSTDASDPQWAPDRDNKAGSKVKTVITEPEHQSDVAGVCWDNARQAWRALWCEKGGSKRKQKSFYVKDHGFDTAKALAEEHRRELERTGRASVRKLSKHQSGVKGVWYDKANNCWMASWQEGGKEKRKPFSIAELGYEGAKQAAIGHRRAMEAKHYRYHNKGETAAK